MAAFNLRTFSNPDLLRSIAPKRLAAFFLPWRPYLVGRGFAFPTDGAPIDCEHLSRVLMEPDETVPKDMVDALYYVNETTSDEDMDTLLELAKSRHVEIDDDPQTTAADVAIQMWLAAPDALRIHHAEAIALRQKSFLYYGGARDTKRAFPEVGDELRSRIEAALDDWFEEHRRGRGCRVFLFPHGDRVWIVIRHGELMRREASQREDGSSTTEFYRPQKHDVLIYDMASDEMGVHAGTRGESRLYLLVLGGLLFGDEDYFPPSDKFTLDPLIEDGVGSLVCEDIDGLEDVRLVEFRRLWGGAYKEIEIRKASDIFGALNARGQKLGSKGRLVGAVFKIKFEGASKERSVSINPPGSAKYERSEDSDLIEVWLAKRGFILKPDTGGDDDDAPTPVVEIA